jgi:ACS family sodium-dependent inorganic phosphate cotransporter
MSTTVRVIARPTPCVARAHVRTSSCRTVSVSRRTVAVVGRRECECETSRTSHPSALVGGVYPRVSSRCATVATRATSGESAEVVPAPNVASGAEARVIVLALGVAMLLASADRTIFAAAALSIKAELGMTMKDVALAQSSFLWGYGVTQLAAGAASDKYGGAKVLLAGLAFWSLAVAATPLCTMMQAPIIAVVASRFLFGAASGCALPASAAAVAAHITPDRRSGALSTIFGLFNIGSAFGLAAAGSLIAAFGWKMIFYAFGAFGLAWAIGSYAIMPGSVKEYVSIVGQEKAVKDDNGEVMTELSSEVATQLVALLWCHIVVNWGFMILQSWLPVYLANDLGMSIASSGVAGALPWVFTAFMSFSSGQIADKLIARGMERWKVRRLAMNIATIGPALGLYSLKFTTSPTVALACIVATLGLQAVAVAGYHSYLQDVAPSRAGAILGFTNTVGVVGAVIANIVTGASVEATGSFQATFLYTAAMYMSSCFVWNSFLRGQKLFP